MNKNEKNVVHIKISGHKPDLVRWQKKLARMKDVELIKSGKNTNRYQPDSPFSEIFRKIGSKKCFFYVDAKISE